MSAFEGRPFLFLRTLVLLGIAAPPARAFVSPPQGRNVPLTFSATVVGEEVANRARVDEGPYNSFQNLISERIEEADECSRTVGRSPPVVTFGELGTLARSDGEDESNLQNERKRLVQSMQDSGGCLLVELTRTEASIVDGMWKQMEQIYRIRDDDDGTCAAEGIGLELRHQMLTRKEDVDEKTSGYQFVTTFIDRGDFIVDPPSVTDAIGMENAFDLLGAYRLFERIGRDASAVSAAGIADMGIDEAADLVQFMLDHGGESDGCGHRLCRYLATSEENENGEGLCTHTDWSLATPVPVSSIAGLEVFVPKDQGWIRPEVEAKRLAEEKGLTPSCYVVVMMGKWLEVVTRGRFLTCVHRVMPGAVQQRLSAPFFMRPREKLFVDVLHRYDTEEGDVEEGLLNLNGQEAIECMNNALMKEYSVRNSHALPKVSKDPHKRRRPKF